MKYTGQYSTVPLYVRMYVSTCTEFGYPTCLGTMRAEPGRTDGVRKSAHTVIYGSRADARESS